MLKGDLDISRIYVYDSWITSTAILYGSVIFDNCPHTYYRQHENNQLGTGAGRMGQLVSSFKRIYMGDGHSFKKQAAYFIELNRLELQVKGSLDYLNSFVGAKSLRQRIKVIAQKKLFRQSVLETNAFYLAYLVGKY